jgi:hypothetical protein
MRREGPQDSIALGFPFLSNGSCRPVSRTNHKFPLHGEQPFKALYQEGVTASGKIRASVRPAEKNVPAEKNPRRFVIKPDTSRGMSRKMKNPERAGFIPFPEKDICFRKGPPESIHIGGVSSGGGKTVPVDFMGAGPKIMSVIPVNSRLGKRAGTKNASFAGIDQIRQSRQMIKMAVSQKNIPGNPV